jgi:hypothetical protein
MAHVSVIMMTYYNDRLVICFLFIYTLHFLNKPMYYIQKKNKYMSHGGKRMPTSYTFDASDF